MDEGTDIRAKRGKGLDGISRGGSIRSIFLVVAVVVVVLLLLISAGFAIWRCAEMVRASHMQELVKDLEDTATQSARLTEIELNDEVLILRGLSARVADNLNNGWSETQIVDFLDSVDQVYGYKNLGYIDTDRNVYSITQTGYTATDDSSSRLLESFAGKEVITAPMYDSYDSSHGLINVIRVPVFEHGNEGGSVIGVLFAAFDSSTFDHILDVDEYEGAGSAYMIDENGEILDCTNDGVSTERYGESLLTSLESAGEDNEDAASELRTSLAAGESGDTEFNCENGESLYVYHTLLDISNGDARWQLAVVVPSSYMESQVDSMMTSVYRMLGMVVFCLILIIGAIACAVWHSHRANRRRLRSLAYQDPLTGGDNYNRFKEQLEDETLPGAIVSVDIRSFKDVNSVCGVERGDQILVMIWHELEKALTPNDFAARVNGDHFVAFLQYGAKASAKAFSDGDPSSFEDGFDPEVTADIKARLEPVSAAIARMSHDLETPVLVPAFGVYRWEPGYSVEECYSRAVSAGQHANANADENVAFFTEEDLRKLNEDSATIQSFEPALAHGEFEPFYQPKYSTDGKLVGAEALARWRKPDGSLVPPYKFIPLFEHNGMIRALDEDIFRQVCVQQAVWKAEGRAIVPVSINLSRASMQFAGVVDVYRRIIEETQVSPDNVPIEITESAIAEDSEVANLTSELRAAGFSIHMDDFGSGYSSLAALGSMNFDALKIDKSLVDCIGGAQGENLLRHSVALAREMNLTVTAEGVETADQVAFLDCLGCDNIQGFYFSKPLPLSDFSKLLGYK